MSAPVLEVNDLTVTFDSRQGRVLTAVDTISLSVDRGRVLGIVGESGSGKSVTGLAILGLIDAPGRIASGSVKLDGTELVGMPERELRRRRGRDIAMVFQDPMATLNPVLRIDTQMIETIRAHDRVSHRAARQRAIEALTKVGIPSAADRLESYPHEFSGGMRQRVAIAIALIHSPAVLVADEPTTALDVTIQGQILAQVQALCAETGTALIWITHDLAVVAGLADAIAVMYGGRIVESGTVDAVLDQPGHPYTAGLLGSVPSRNRKGEPLAHIPGSAPSLSVIRQGCTFALRCARATDICRKSVPELSGEAHRLRCFHPLTNSLVAEAV